MTSTNGKSYVESNCYNWKSAPQIIENERQVTTGYSIVDLFCGAGGFSVGFSDAGFAIALGIDNHAPSKETFIRNHPESHFILGDIRQVETKQIEILSRRINPSVIVAGIPCQGFSNNNKKRKDDDERNFLFWEFIRFAKFFKSPYVLVENVSGIKSAGNGYFVEAITHEIEALGYSVDHRVLQAADYGVPQRRTRVFFIGAQPGYEIRWPVPTHGIARGRRYETIYDAISDLPELNSGEQKTSYEREPITEYQKLLRKNADAILHNHKAPSHPLSTIKKIEATLPGKPMYPKFPQRIRLSMDDLSPTQIAGGIRSQFTYGHPTQPRGLSIRERARIQSFPDHFVFYGGLVQERIQTGNAVPPLLACAIAKEIRKGLNHEPLDESTIKKSSTQMALL